MSETFIIQSFTDEGLGLTLRNEKPFLVPFTLLQEEVTLSSPFKKDGKRFSEALEIVKPSPFRVSPFCPHFTECGGCRTQHLDYQEELRWKEERIRKLFAPFDAFEFFPILPAPSFTAWRNKMEFTFSPYGELGLHRYFGKGRVFNTVHCSLGPPWFEEAAELIRTFQKEQNLSSFDSRKGEGSLRNLTLRHAYHTGDRMLFLTVSGNSRFAWNAKNIEAFKKVGEALNVSLFLVLHQAIKGHPTEYFEMHLGGKDSITEHLTVKEKELKFLISPKAFFQPNHRQAEKIYETTLDFLDLKPDEVLLDLFAGTGTIGLFASPYVKKVVSIELSPEACLDAKQNCALNGIDNIQILQGDVEDILKKGGFPKPDALVVDPPRAGLTPKALEAILQLKPQKIAYISCNPNTQVQNLLPLVEQGWKIRAVQPVDQFPRSPHVENITLLTRGTP